MSNKNPKKEDKGSYNPIQNPKFRVTFINIRYLE